MRTTIIHASGRFDRPVQALAADLLDFSHQGASIITLTEQNSLTQKRRTALRFPGWSWFHVDEKGAADCAVLWDNAHWMLDGWARAVPLTSLVWRRVASMGGNTTPPVHATVAPLRARSGGARLVVIAVHMPTRSTALRRRAWASCVKGLMKLVREVRKADPHAKIVLNADWNADWRKRADRTLLLSVANRLNLSPVWAHHHWRQGTHGNRVIDAVFTDAAIGSATVLDQTKASDHRAVKAVLSVTRGRGDA